MTSIGGISRSIKKLGQPDLKKMKNFGGNMKRFSILFILVFAVAAFGQEAMEAPAEEMATDMMADSAAVDSMAMDDMMMADSAAVDSMAMEEPMMEEDAGDALEAMLAEEGTMETEVTSGSALIGYTVGVNFGFPVYMSSGLGDAKAAPIFGIVANTPYGLTIGPFDFGVGVELGMYDFSDVQDYKGIIALATLNTAVLNTPSGAISAEVGGGYYGASVGATLGASFSYAIPGVPLVINPYARANATLSSGDNEVGSVAWLNIGATLKADISALF
jgi:hypothetical protein